MAVLSKLLKVAGPQTARCRLASDGQDLGSFKNRQDAHANMHQVKACLGKSSKMYRHVTVSQQMLISRKVGVSVMWAKLRMTIGGLTMMHGSHAAAQSA